MQITTWPGMKAKGLHNHSATLLLEVIKCGKARPVVGGMVRYMDNTTFAEHTCWMRQAQPEQGQLQFIRQSKFIGQLNITRQSH